MRRRKLGWGLAGLAAVLCAVGVFVYWLRPELVTPANCNRIQLGMSRVEVESILGSPGEYTTGPVSYRDDESWCEIGGSPTEVLDSPERRFVVSGDVNVGLAKACWCSDAIALTVVFDRDAKAVQTNVYQTRRTNQGTLENLLWRAKRQLHRWFR